MNKKVLMVGFHFPPSTVSSGHLRPLAFANYLPESGWQPVVLSASAFSYESKNPDTIDVIPDSCTVYRAPALDTKRHLGCRGMYPAFLAHPDRWISWWPAAVLTGLYIVRRHRPQVIWSTFPLMTTHLVASALSRLTGLPWIADFRDPIRNTTPAFRRMEKRIVSAASYSVFTAPTARKWYADRYPELESEGRFVVIGNGYDETQFAGTQMEAPPAPTDRPLVLLHSGGLYPDGRNPSPFFEALARLKNKGVVTPSNLQVVLRSSGLPAEYEAELSRLQLDGIVRLAGHIANREALKEQARADGLLLFQGPKFDMHIPAKVYEYLRVGRPIFALVGKDGDSADLLRTTGGAEIVDIDDVDAIESNLHKFIEAMREGNAPQVIPNVASRYSRRQSTLEFARLLDDVTAK